MPIDNLPGRLRELGRLKFGEDLGDRPTQLTVWRLTSPNPELIEAAARLWGGVPAWKAEGGGEVVTETGTLDVLIPPQDVAGGQWWELWSAGGLQRRCSGSALVEYDPDEPTGFRKVAPCVCDEENAPRACKPTTVLRVLLPQLPDLGVWKLNTRSAYAAAELPAAVDFLLQRSSPAPAVLSLDQRTAKKPGQKPRHYVVPVLGTHSTLLELTSLPAGQGLQPLPLEPGQAPEALTANSARRDVLPAREPGPEILPGAPQNPAKGVPQAPNASQEASGENSAHTGEPGRSARRQALVDFLAEIDPAEIGRVPEELIRLLEELEALAVAADVWQPGGLDAAAAKWVDSPAEDWRDAPGYLLQTFARRAVLALGKEKP